jgi:hypothetical protein
MLLSFFAYYLCMLTRERHRLSTEKSITALAALFSKGYRVTDKETIIFIEIQKNVTIILLISTDISKINDGSDDRAFKAGDSMGLTEYFDQYEAVPESKQANAPVF